MEIRFCFAFGKNAEVLEQKVIYTLSKYCGHIISLLYYFRKKKDFQAALTLSSGTQNRTTVVRTTSLFNLKATGLYKNLV